MPRFDNEGFNPQRRINNDNRDRSVPVDEDYYNADKQDFNLADYKIHEDDVIDNQQNINSYIDNFNRDKRRGDTAQDYNYIEPPVRNNRQSAPNFVPQVARDYDAERRKENIRRAKSEPKRKVKKDKPPKRRRRLGLGKRILLAVISLILVCVILVVGLANMALSRVNYDDKVTNQYVSSADLQDSMSVKNILLLGVDARSGEDDEASRADSMMLISIDGKHHCIKMISFLRDTWVYIPAHDGEQRLNAACTYGGYSGVVDTIEYNFGVDIDGYVVADFEMFKVLVDSIGGVEVDVSEKEAKEVTSHKKRYGNVTLEAGKHKLTGEQALAYCRIRKIDTDFMRAKRQRTVMQSIIKDMKSSNIFTLYKIAYNSAKYIETDLSKAEIMSLAMRATTCLKNDMVETRLPFDDTWEYATISGASVISIDANANKQKLIDYIYNKSADEIKAEED